MERGAGGGEETITFCFPNLLTRLDTELLLCVCWLDKVVLLVHCCLLQISYIQGTPPYPVSFRTFQCLALSAMDVDHIDTYPAGAVVNFQPSGGRIVPAKIVLAAGAGAHCQAPCQACVKGSSGQDRTRLISSVDLCSWQGQDYSNYV